MPSPTYSTGYSSAWAQGAIKQSAAALERQGLFESGAGIQLLGVEELNKKFKELYGSWMDSTFAASKYFAQAVLDLSREYCPYDTGEMYYSGEVRTDQERGILRRTDAGVIGSRRGQFIGAAHLVIYTDPKALPLHENQHGQYFHPEGNPDREGKGPVPPGRKRGEKWLTRALNELSGEFPQQVQQGIEDANRIAARTPSRPAPSAAAPSGLGMGRGGLVKRK